jgi:hypothetical protein
LKLFVLLNRLDAVLGLSDDIEAVLGKDPFDHHPHDDGIVDDEDSFAHQLLPRRVAKNVTAPQQMLGPALPFELNRPKDSTSL